MQPSLLSSSRTLSGIFITQEFCLSKVTVDQIYYCVNPILISLGLRSLFLREMYESVFMTAQVTHSAHISHSSGFIYHSSVGISAKLG